MPPNRLIAFLNRGRRSRESPVDEGGSGGGTGGTARRTTTAAVRPASAAAIAMSSVSSSSRINGSRVALISADGTAERSDAELGLGTTSSFTPRRRLGSAGAELEKRRSNADECAEHKQAAALMTTTTTTTTQHHQRHNNNHHHGLLPLPPLPAMLRRRTSTTNGSGIFSNHTSRRNTTVCDDDVAGGDDDDDDGGSSIHSALAVDVTAADVPPADPRPPKPPSLLRAVPQWWRVAILWFKSPSRWRAIAWFASAIGLSLGVTMMYVEISYIQSSFMTALSGKDAAGFKRAVLRYAGIIAAAAPLFALSDWVEDRLKLAWRAWLASRLMGDYFGNAAFYRLHLVTAADYARAESEGRGDNDGENARNSSSNDDSDRAAAVAATVDNPDQRICDDVAEFAESSVALAIGAVGKVFQMAAFSGVLWSRMPTLVGFIFGYAAVGTVLTASVFGRKLAYLTFATLRREGDLRFDLVRTRENAEAIAFYGGGARERRTAYHKLEKLVRVRRSAILWSAGLSLWTNVYSYATILVPSVMCAPLYFSGRMQFGVISQVTTSFNHIEAALNFLVNHLSRVSTLAAVSARLETLQDALVHARGGGPKIARETIDVFEGEEQGEGEEGAFFNTTNNNNKSGFELAPPPPPPPPARPPQVILRLSSLTVCTPAGGRTLTTSLDLELRAGQSLLVVGPSGCGKSSLLRAIAGLWCRGGGTVAAPAPRRCFFLPQKPYMPLGPLRDQLIFPADSKALARAAAASEARRRAAAAVAAAGGRAISPPPLFSLTSPRTTAAAAGTTPTATTTTTTTTATRATDDGSHPHVDPSLADDSALLDLLDAVALPDLAARVGGLDADVEWAHVLSLGEQQRVAAARLVAAEPRLAFLDEATSAMDQASEARIYEAVKRACGKARGCFVSVGHRPELAKFHTHVLESVESSGGGDGGGSGGERRWRLLTSREWVAERRARALAEAALEEEELEEERRRGGVGL